MVNGRVRALPALIDDLAVVYNKKLFETGRRRRAGRGLDVGRLPRDRQARSPTRGKGTFGTALAGGRRRGHGVAHVAAGVAGAAARSSPTDGKVGFDGRRASRRFDVVNDLAQDKSVYVDTKPGSEQMYQLFNNGQDRHGPDRAVAAAGVHRGQEVDYGVAPLPTFGGEPVTISAPDTWTVFDNGDARSKAAIEFVQWLNQPEQDAQVGSRGGQPAAAQGARSSSPRGRHLKDVPGLQVFIDALTDARVRPTIRAYPKVSPRRSGSRSSPCCSARRRRRRGSNDAAASSARPGHASAEASWPAAAASTPPARRGRCSGSSARRRRAWLFIAPAVVIILGLSLVPMAWSLLLCFKTVGPRHAEHVGRARQLPPRSPTTRSSATPSGTR